MLQSKVKVANYSDSELSLEGTEIMLTCPSELVLLGHNTLTCGDDGRYWTPDPSQTECKGYYYKCIIIVNKVHYKSRYIHKTKLAIIKLFVESPYTVMHIQLTVVHCPPSLLIVM